LRRGNYFWSYESKYKSNFSTNFTPPVLVSYTRRIDLRGAAKYCWKEISATVSCLCQILMYGFLHFTHQLFYFDCEQKPLCFLPVERGVWWRHIWQLRTHSTKSRCAQQSTERLAPIQSPFSRHVVIMSWMMVMSPSLRYEYWLD
jgi:hypothetical protein